MLSQLTRTCARTARNTQVLNSVRALSTSRPSMEKESFLDSSTGKTGGVVLGAGLGIAAFANDMIVVAHPENVVVVTFFSFLAVMYHKVGPIVADGLTSEVEHMGKVLNKATESQIEALKEEIVEEKGTLALPEVMNATHQVKKEIIQMEIDIEQRKKYDAAANLIKARLDAISNLEAKIRADEQAELVNAVQASVINHFKSQKSEAAVVDGVKQLQGLKFSI